MCKRFCLVTLAVLALTMFLGCRNSDIASYNLSREADSFNIPRRVTVFNVRTNQILFQMDGYFSIKLEQTDTGFTELQLTGDNGENKYYKHFIAIPVEVTYVVQQLSEYPVSDRHYRFYINPDMALPELYMFDGKSTDGK